MARSSGPIMRANSWRNYRPIRAHYRESKMYYAITSAIHTWWLFLFVLGGVEAARRRSLFGCAHRFGSIVQQLLYNL